jgi:hypothetical protein
MIFHIASNYVPQRAVTERQTAAGIQNFHDTELSRSVGRQLT